MRAAPAVARKGTHRQAAPRLIGHPINYLSPRRMPDRHNSAADFTNVLKVGVACVGVGAVSVGAKQIPGEYHRENPDQS